MRKLNFNILQERIDNIAQYDFAKNKVFGSAYYVYQDGIAEYEKCYGNVSLDVNAPVMNDTLFRLASMTKPITAFAALILVDRGIISLDDTVDSFLMNFKDIPVTDNLGNCNKPIHMPTIRNILSHSSGIASNYDKCADMTVKDKATLDNSIAYYIKKGLDFEPSTAQMYSGTSAFDVLVKIIETVIDKDFPEFLKNEIFEPCGMQNTTFAPTREQEKKIIKMHHRINDKNTEFQMPNNCIFEDFPCTHYLGGAGLVSTLCDYSKFAKMLLNNGKVGNNRLISEETFGQFYTPQISKKIMPGNERWGLGVRVITEPEYPYLPVGCFGWSGAYGSHFWIDPVNNLFAVFMKNSKVDGGSGNESATNFEKAVYSSFDNKI